MRNFGIFLVVGGLALMIGVAGYCQSEDEPMVELDINRKKMLYSTPTILGKTDWDLKAAPLAIFCTGAWASLRGVVLAIGARAGVPMIVRPAARK